MLSYKKGNLLEEPAEALVNTVNTVGIMGKDIALMFKEQYPDNYSQYKKACKENSIQVGKMFVTTSNSMMNPKWIINFPTKKHWRTHSQIQWIREGLKDLRNVLEQEGIKSVALPPLGSGNGGLDWEEVKAEIEFALSDIRNIEIIIYEPTGKYQNTAKKKGMENLTPARALLTEMVRNYWFIGMNCSLLEAHKLAWFISQSIIKKAKPDPLKLEFKPNAYGPYAHNLNKLINHIDGSYLLCGKRISDANPYDLILFNHDYKEKLKSYLQKKAMHPYMDALDHTKNLIDGFQSPFGMELLATVDWLMDKERTHPDVKSIREGLKKWPGPPRSAQRKTKIFDDRSLNIALTHLLKIQPSHYAPQ